MEKQQHALKSMADVFFIGFGAGSEISFTVVSLANNIDNMLLDVFSKDLLLVLSSLSFSVS